MAYRIVRYQLRRNSADRWTYLDPVLLEGEQGLETDTGRIKIGDGISSWTKLKYHGESDAAGVTHGQLTEHMDAHINSEAPHPVYDDAPSLILLYQNAKV